MTTLLLWIPAVFLAVAAAALSYALLSTFDDLMRLALGWRRRTALALKRVARRFEPPKEMLLSEEELYGLPRSMVLWMLLAAGVGVAFTWALFDGPMEVLGVGAGIAPLMWRRRKLERAQQETRRQVAWLIEEIRLRLLFGGSLGPALILLPDQGPEGVVFERLRAYKDEISLYGPEEVLEKLANELRSPELRLLLRRVRASRRGKVTYAEALKAAADEVARETYRRADLVVEAAPLQLLIPMLILLLPPILTLLLYPPVYGLIDTLTGAGAGALP